VIPILDDPSETPVLPGFLRFHREGHPILVPWDPYGQPLNFVIGPALDARS
jgi:hypothetical protein